MTEAAAILEIRNVRLAEQATLQPAPLGEGEEGVFVALDDPPPVRTVLTVVEGEQRRALEVAWVVEVAERDAVRGFYGRWVDDEAQQRAAKVGTEHLEDGTPVVQPVVPDNSLSIDVSDGMMAMPAPVMIHDDDTGVVDVSEDEEGAEAASDEGPSDEGAEAAASEQEPASEGAAEAASDEASEEGAEAAPDDASEEGAEGEAAAEGEASAEGEEQDAASEDEASGPDDAEAGESEASGGEEAAASDDGKKRRKKRGRRRK